VVAIPAQAGSPQRELVIHLDPDSQKAKWMTSSAVENPACAGMTTFLYVAE